jgi:hypothetical protein
MRRIVLAVALALAFAAAPTTAHAFVSPGFSSEPEGGRVLSGRWRVSSWSFNGEERHVPVGTEVELTESTLRIAGIGWRFGDDALAYKLDDPDATIVMSMQLATKGLWIDAVIEVDGSLTLAVYGENDDDEEIFVVQRID